MSRLLYIGYTASKVYEKDENVCLGPRDSEYSLHDHPHTEFSPNALIPWQGSICLFYDEWETYTVQAEVRVWVTWRKSRDSGVRCLPFHFHPL